MDLFEDYIQKKENEKESAEAAVEAARNEAMQRERQEAEFVRIITPYIEEGLSSILGVIKKLNLTPTLFYYYYETGLIFKKKERRKIGGWCFARLGSEQDLTLVKPEASAVFLTEENRFVSPYKYGEYAPILNEFAIEGTYISLREAVTIIAEEMKQSIETTRFCREHAQKLMEMRTTSAEKREIYEQRLKNDNLDLLIDQQDYQGAVKRYFEYSLDNMDGHGLLSKHFFD